MDNCYLATNEISCQTKQLVVTSFCPAIFDLHMSAFNESRLLQSLTKPAQSFSETFSRFRANKSDNGNILRLARDWAGSHAANQPYELPAPHSITSSARAS